MTIDLDSIDVPQLPVEDLPGIPDCRVLATVDPRGGLRFEVDRGYARDVRDQLQHQRRVSDPGGSVDLTLVVGRRAYTSLTKGLAQLHKADDVVIKQVQVAPEPDVAISVYLNDSQIEDSMRKNYKVLQAVTDPRQLFGQQFSISWNGSVVLDQQIEAAIDGIENPMDAVDPDDDRFVDGGEGR